MIAFTYTSRPGRIVFGAGAIERVAEELDELCIRRALVLCTPEQRFLADRVRRIAGEHCADVFDRAVMHVPVETAQEGVAAALAAGADGLVAAGGGSTLGLAKAIALETSLPILAIPTTYAGSEVTPIYGMTSAGEKKTGKSYRVLPRTVIYDACLTLTLPAALSATSGLNAIAHAAEGLYAQDANPVMSLFAEEGIRSLAHALPRIVEQPDDIAAREAAQYGAWLCGTVLGSVGMALHHKLCHTLGGMFDLPHAETHAVMLPYSMAFNLPAAPAAHERLCRALDTPEPATSLYDLGRSLHAPASLKALGLRAADIPTAAAAAMQAPYYNPRPLSYEAVHRLLTSAFDGMRPDSRTFESV
ncbi:Maleylacetate reductase [Paraburkholderia graminis C4D1M]|jgi:alcohol dehydrogenase class IV|uniref:Iron-containing alcohol dehydrogenase n=3 Tax=Paraburkholderia graminis TaxID=60548 RepID=B1G546_PARG4|nr:maleylacetate reductase [Paraburkholderia graminis]EDT08807.1 iron-containing alcohol dehydrogenase [Paraburkholderia graminis C4D1M]MDQ0622749.1 maleylacetate reductase [Paraburkholderia graminis]MDR6207073.1 maleylacetate reductase [Paraburkholderia graminis]CAB3643951.1 Maleylacetate reductase [Paraburkholderia graminis C4D1M]